MSWSEPANWTNGVPSATSHVCISSTAVGPRVPQDVDAVADVIDADGATVTIRGRLAVGTSFDVAALVGDFGELHGPGTTTVTDEIAGYRLILREAVTVALRQDASIGGQLDVVDGSRLDVRGDVLLEPEAVIVSFDSQDEDDPGFVTVTETGSLTFNSPDETAVVDGGFANHGEVRSLAGALLMLGAVDKATPEQYSTGSFSGAPGATMIVAYTELHTGARLNHVLGVDNITVPAGHTVSVADSELWYDPQSEERSFSGAGELVVTDGTRVRARIGGSLTLSVPAGEVVKMGGAILQDSARVRVEGELAQDGDISLEDDAVLDVYGVHRAQPGGLVTFAGADPGLEVIHPDAELRSDGDRGLTVLAPFVNQGTVRSGTGNVYVGPRVASPAPSSGTFRGDPAGALYLGSNADGDPPLELDQPVIEGEVKVAGDMLANSPQLRGQLSTMPRDAHNRGGRLTLTGTATLSNGASLAGDVLVAGELESDPGATGTATLSGAEVAGAVHAVSGTLEVPTLAPSTLRTDGTLSKGEWSAVSGARLEMPPIRTNDAVLTLKGAGASFGHLRAQGNGPKGTIDLRSGADLELSGGFRNEGRLRLSSGSRLITGANFRQLPTGRLVSQVNDTGLGRVRAEGRRDLAGELVVRRDPTYRPPVGTVLSFLTSDGRASRDDEFDTVTSPRYDARKLRVLYKRNHVRLWVDRIS